MSQTSEHSMLHSKLITTHGKSELIKRKLFITRHGKSDLIKKS